MRVFKELLTPLSVLILAGVIVYDHTSPRVGPGPEAAVNGEALGRAYSPALVAAYADGWVAAAKTLEEGKPIAEAQRSLQDTWKDARIKAFRAEVQPGFSVVLPEGTEPTDPAKRSQVAQLWRSFAKGLKRGR